MPSINSLIKTQLPVYNEQETFPIVNLQKILKNEPVLQNKKMNYNISFCKFSSSGK